MKMQKTFLLSLVSLLIWPFSLAANAADYAAQGQQGSKAGGIAVHGQRHQSSGKAAQGRRHTPSVMTSQGRKFYPIIHKLDLGERYQQIIDQNRELREENSRLSDQVYELQSELHEIYNPINPIDDACESVVMDSYQQRCKEIAHLYKVAPYIIIESAQIHNERYFEHILKAFGGYGGSRLRVIQILNSCDRRNPASLIGQCVKRMLSEL